MSTTGGSLKGKERQKIVLRYTGRVPEPSLAFLDVRVVNFDKQTIVLCGRAVFPRFTAGVIRVVDDTQRFFTFFFFFSFFHFFFLSFFSLCVCLC